MLALSFLSPCKVILSVHSSKVEKSWRWVWWLSGNLRTGTLISGSSYPRLSVLVQHTESQLQSSSSAGGNQVHVNHFLFTFEWSGRGILWVLPSHPMCYAFLFHVFFNHTLHCRFSKARLIDAESHGQSSSCSSSPDLAFAFLSMRPFLLEDYTLVGSRS